MVVMPLLPRFRLSDGEKDALLAQQQELIERLAARVTELEALVGRPRKTLSNSHVPPSKDGFGRGKEKTGKASTKPRPSREDKARPLTETPDRTERVVAAACGHCGTDVSGAAQRCRHRYDHIDLPPIRSVVTRVELLGGGCGRRYRAAAPAGMAPGTPFAADLPAPQPSCRLRAAVAACRRDVRPHHLARRYRQHVPAPGREHGHRDRCDPREAAHRPDHRFGRDDDPDEWRHPVAVGVHLGSGGAARDRPAPGAQRRGSGAGQPPPRCLDIRSLWRPAGPGWPPPGLPGSRPARRPIRHRLRRYRLRPHNPRPSAMVDRGRPATTAAEGHHPCQLCGQGRPESDLCYICVLVTAEADDRRATDLRRLAITARPALPPASTAPRSRQQPRHGLVDHAIELDPSKPAPFASTNREAENGRRVNTSTVQLRQKPL